VDIEAITHLYETVDPVESVSQSRLDLYSEFLEGAALRFGTDKKLLDVGCSSGTFIELATKQGWQAFGIEPSETLAEKAQSKGLKAACGVLAQLPEGWGPFNLITYWDSFMLVDNPFMEMERALSHLHEGGWIYLRLRQHGFQKFLYAFWKIIGRPFRLPNPSAYHLYNFTPKTIRILADRMELHVEIRNSTFTKGDPYNTMRLKSIAVMVKVLSAWLADIMHLVSCGRLFWSPGMDIWLQRKI
jgi:SAM-dependent methyltransferase